MAARHSSKAKNIYRHSLLKVCDKVLSPSRTWACSGGSLEPLTGLRLRNAMGSSCAWHPNGFQIALTFTSGDIAVVVSSRTIFCQS